VLFGRKRTKGGVAAPHKQARGNEMERKDLTQRRGKSTAKSKARTVVSLTFWYEVGCVVGVRHTGDVFGSNLTASLEKRVKKVDSSCSIWRIRGGKKKQLVSLRRAVSRVRVLPFQKKVQDRRGKERGRLRSRERFQRFGRQMVE